MIIYINDKPFTLDSSCSVEKMLGQRDVIDAHVAIAINNQFVPKSMFSNTILSDGDRIDLIVPMQGG